MGRDAKWADKAGTATTPPGARERDSRKRSRSRERSSPVGRAAPGARGEGTRARSPTPPPAKPRPPEYAVRVPPFSFTTVERDYGEVAKRYVKLMIPPDFAKLRATWPLAPAWGARPHDSLGLSTVYVDRPTRFEHELGSLDPDNRPPVCEVLSKRHQESAKPHTDGVRYAVRVLLLQGVTLAERGAVARGPHHEGGSHLVHALRFVTARYIDAAGKRGVRGVLGALGGMWSPKLDGGDPTAGDDALKAAAIRHVKALAGVDLSACSSWTRICEVHYSRPVSSSKSSSEAAGGCGEEYPLVVVMFCVLADDLMPSLADWPAQYAAISAWRAEKDAAEGTKKEAAAAAAAAGEGDKAGAQGEAKAEVGADAKPDTKPDIQPAASSDGGAGAAPAAPAAAAAPGAGGVVGLLPEPFIHLKGQHNRNFKVRTAVSTLHSLLDYDEEDDEEPTFELCVFAEAFHELLMRDYATIIMSHLSHKRYPCPPFDAEHKAEDKEAAKSSARRTDMPLLLAFRYFDRTGCGYVKPEDLRRMLHNTSCGLPHRVVKQLAANMATATGASKNSDKLYYRDLTDKGPRDSTSGKERSPSPNPDPPPPPPPPPAPAATVKEEGGEAQQQQQEHAAAAGDAAVKQESGAAATADTAGPVKHEEGGTDVEMQPAAAAVADADAVAHAASVAEGAADMAGSAAPEEAAAAMEVGEGQGAGPGEEQAGGAPADTHGAAAGAGSEQDYVMLAQ